LGSFHRERFRLGQELLVSFGVGLLVSLACSFLFQAGGMRARFLRAVRFRFPSTSRFWFSLSSSLSSPSARTEPASLPAAGFLVRHLRVRGGQGFAILAVE